MAFEGDERATNVAYESVDPGPKKGETIAMDFLRIQMVLKTESSKTAAPWAAEESETLVNYGEPNVV